MEKLSVFLEHQVIIEISLWFILAKQNFQWEMLRFAGAQVVTDLNAETESTWNTAAFLYSNYLTCSVQFFANVQVTQSLFEESVKNYKKNWRHIFFCKE